MKINLSIVLLSVLILSSCASNYIAIRPDKMYYPAIHHLNNVTISSKYNVLEEKGNRKYAKKERKKGIQLIAVEVTNHTNRPINFRKDIQLYAGNRAVYPLETHVIYKHLKQISPLYLLYMLLTPMKFYTYNGVETSAFPIGLIVGPGITLYNFVTASKANNTFKNELMAKNMIDYKINPGETVSGLLGIFDARYEPLSVEIIGTQEDLKITNVPEDRF